MQVTDNQKLRATYRILREYLPIDEAKEAAYQMHLNYGMKLPISVANIIEDEELSIEKIK